MLFVPSPSIFDNYSIAFFLGLIITLMGQSIRMLTIGLVYIIRGGKDRKVYAEELVTTGIFNHSRNPMYVGNVTMLLGMGILANSLFFLLILFPFFVFVYQAIIKAEENFLHQKFGAGYEKYMQNVPRWLPNLNGIRSTLQGMTFNWSRVILKEYNSTFVWMMAAILLIIKNFYVIGGENLILEYHYPLLLTSVILIVIYLTIKILKKTGKWVAN
jgi:protein-S-isoprenylcysteine O-methyltransferase Ste14